MKEITRIVNVQVTLIDQGEEIDSIEEDIKSLEWHYFNALLPADDIHVLGEKVFMRDIDD